MKTLFKKLFKAKETQKCNCKSKITEDEYTVLMKELLKKKINIQVHKTDVKTLCGDTCIYKFGYCNDSNYDDASLFLALNNFDEQERELVRKIVSYMF